ncbi:MAG: hypothetical protein HY514_03560, partial [Candidatus Aenigmarchaeota archaeon]|nr:hypothetical protein [Candidatus Aenigmarchaeota archaeon]
GTWQLVSCSSDSSQSADCSNANRTQTLALARAINVIKSDKLDIVSASLSANNITIGESVSASVGVRNPTEIDRFSQVFCTFRTQNQANLINSSACSLIRKDAQENIIVTVKPPFIGRWNVTECKATSSLNVDCAQSKEDDTISAIGLFDVNSATQAAPSGNVSGNVSAVKCEILRFRPECVFGKSTNRYTVSAEMSWEGGDHAHVIIGDDSGPLKYTDKTFTTSKVIATPGKINVKPVVHDAGDNVICSRPVQEVFCLAGNVTTTELVQVIRNMKDAAPPGPVQVELYIGPLEHVANFTLTEHVDQSLPISNVVISGNQTLVRMDNKTVTSTELDKPYQALGFNTALRQGQNITIAYTVDAQKEGDYKFFHVANASGEVAKGPFFNLFITTCPQIKRTLAVGPGGSCQSFRTSCDVPPGWKIEEKCPETQVTPPAGGGDGTLAIIAIVIIIIIVAIGYKKRDAIREKLSKIRKRKGEEEFPSDFRLEER